MAHSACRENRDHACCAATMGSVTATRLCKSRSRSNPRPPVPGTEPWLRTWEVENVRCGVIDLIWDVREETG